MENEKLTYINSRGERLELGVDSVYHCNISKDVEGISGVTSVIYSTNSMGQHGDTCPLFFCNFLRKLYKSVDNIPKKVYNKIMERR